MTEQMITLAASGIAIKDSILIGFVKEEVQSKRLSVINVEMAKLIVRIHLMKPVMTEILWTI